MKLTIEYDQDKGYIFPDGKAEEWVDKTLEHFLKQEEDQHIKVCSSLLVDFFRLRLCQGIIDTSQIEFIFDGVTLEHNEYGRITHWPKGYCDIPIEPVEQMLTLAYKKRKKPKWSDGPELIEESEV